MTEEHTDLADAHRDIERLEREVARRMAELDEVRRQVYTLENSESAEAIRLNCLVKELEAERDQAREDTRRIAETWHAVDAEHIATRDKLHLTQDKLEQAEQALVELKKTTLIGPLTAEEWMEFRLRTDEDEERELLRCCANTSAIRDDIFHLMRSYAEDPLLGTGPIIRIREAVEDHGGLTDPRHPSGLRLTELLDRMAEYYRREPA